MRHCHLGRPAEESIADPAAIGQGENATGKTGKTDRYVLFLYLRWLIRLLGWPRRRGSRGVPRVAGAVAIQASRRA